MTWRILHKFFLIIPLSFLSVEPVLRLHVPVENAAVRDGSGRLQVFGRSAIIQLVIIRLIYPYTYQRLWIFPKFPIDF